MTLAWTGPDGKRVVVPPVHLYPDLKAEAPGGLTGAYFTGTGFEHAVGTRVDPGIDFSWDQQHPLPAFKDAEAVIQHVWPEGLRRFSYRRQPDLPSGYGGHTYDSVLLGFNAIPFEQEPGWLTHLPGRMPKFVKYKDIDYEFALNPVAADFGGGSEVFCLETPAMPRKHFYPRQPQHPEEGPVDDAQLAIEWRDGTRFMECAIPWKRIPHVHALMQAGEPVKFSFKVLHQDGGPVMELSTGRSAAEGISTGFHPDWNTSYPVELEFGWEP
jgi:hypothetical protein